MRDFDHEKSYLKLSGALPPQREGRPSPTPFPFQPMLSDSTPSIFSTLRRSG